MLNYQQTCKNTFFFLYVPTFAKGGNEYNTFLIYTSTAHTRYTV